jgi:hypothetical protein
VKDWSKYDDPQTTSQNILLELQKLGIELDIAPTKIKAGFGEGVCQLLLKLTQISLQNKFRFKKPVIRSEDSAVDDEPEDNDGDLDGGADLADVIHADEGDDDMMIDEELELGGNNAHNDLARQMEAEMAANAII